MENFIEANKQIEKEIIEAIVFLREKNQTIPSETIELMKVASLGMIRGTLVQQDESI